MFHVKTRIVFGDNTIEEIRNHETEECLVVCGKHVRRDRSFRVIKRSLKIKRILDDIAPEPSVSDIKQHWNRIKDDDFDLVVAIGGGSVLDTSKIIATLMTNNKKIEDIIGVENIKSNIKKLIAIPTTHGSGSEVTKYAVLRYMGVKSTIVSEKIYPTIAIIDPLLTVTLPKELTAYTAMDALTHNLEAFISKKSDPLTNIVAARGIELGIRNIERAYNDGTDIGARRNLVLASVLGGIAITNASAGIVHALSHVLGGLYPVEHGHANAIFLPYSVKFNYNEKILRIERKLKIDLFRYLEELNERLNIKRLSDITDNGREIAEKAYENKRLMRINPKPIKLKDLIEIVNNSM